MRVLLVSHTCQSRTEGQPKAKWLARAPDVDLLLLTPDRWRHYGRWRNAEAPESSAFRIEVGKVRFPWLGPAQNYLHFYPSLAKTLERFRPDVIDLWEEPWGLVSAHACRLRNRLLPLAKIISETEQNIDKRLPFPFEQLRAYTLRNADHAVARSEGAADVLRAKGYRGPIAVVGNAVDDDLFRPLDRRACRARLGMDGFVVGYVGRLVPEKGVTDLMEAVARLPAAARLCLIGDGPLRGELEALAVKLKIVERVRILPAMPTRELPEWMNVLDVLALPSRTTERWKEQFGRVIIEAHACGVPVVGSSSGAIPGVVGAGGLVVPERRPQELAAALARLMDDSELGRRLGDHGRFQVERRYTWRRVAERMTSIYRRVVGEQGPLDAVTSSNM